MRRQRRYTAHRNSFTGSWYVWDHLVGLVDRAGIASEREAWELAGVAEFQFDCECQRLARQELAS